MTDDRKCDGVFHVGDNVVTETYRTRNGHLYERLHCSGCGIAMSRPVNKNRAALADPKCKDEPAPRGEK